MNDDLKGFDGACVVHVRCIFCEDDYFKVGGGDGGVHFFIYDQRIFPHSSVFFPHSAYCFHFFFSHESIYDQFVSCHLFMMSAVLLFTYLSQLAS